MNRPVSESNVNLDDVGDKGAFLNTSCLKKFMSSLLPFSEPLVEELEKGKVFDRAFGPEAEKLLPKVEHVQIIACGTSYHAGLTARYWLEEVCRCIL